MWAACDTFVELVWAKATFYCQLVGHISDRSVTHRQLLSVRVSSFPPPSTTKKTEKMISNQICSSLQLSVLWFCPASIYLHQYNPPPPYFCPLSLFPCFLLLYLSISITLLSIITPLLPPPPYQHHASCLSLSLSFMPFLLPSIFTQTCKRVSSSSFHLKQFN